MLYTSFALCDKNKISNIMSIQLLNGVYHIKNEKTFTELIDKSLNDKNVIIFVKFSAPLCGPCKKNTTTL